MIMMMMHAHAMMHAHSEPAIGVVLAVVGFVLALVLLRTVRK